MAALAVLLISTSTAASAQPASKNLLDVPYLTQTEDLCGGAAVAMVLRYWGDRQVRPEDFSSLIDRSAAGIRSDVLAADVSRRGWQAFPVSAGGGDGGGWLRLQIDQGRPVVALIEVAPGRYHYVVVVAWTADYVIAHDPARAPFRMLPHADFDNAWAAAGRWALLILPGVDRGPAPAPVAPIPARTETASTVDACSPWIAEMVDRARAGARDEAEAGLLAATRLCPRNPAAWRELAGLRFLQSRWSEASELAARAAAIDPADREGWDLLATSRFLDGQAGPAIEAWNQIGRPALDVVRVEGVVKTRHPVVVDLIGLPPRAVLTAAMFERAERRLGELPSAAVTRLRYRPVAGGLADVEAVVVERSTWPRGAAPLAVIATKAVLQQEATLHVSAPFGGGELWTVAGRWTEARPRIGFTLAVPRLSSLPGITTAEGSWERQSYQTPTGIANPAHRRAALTVADWATRDLRWQVGAAFDRWAQAGYLSASVALDRRLAGDRLSLGVSGEAARPLQPGPGFMTGRVAAAWRSTRDAARPSWLAHGGFTAASAAAPFDLWPGAGTGLGRAPLLRAHPLLAGGVISGPAFGRRLAHATVEYGRPIMTIRIVAVRAAAFADFARAWRGFDPDGRSQADVGAGLRIGLRGDSGNVRLDFARGLRDARMVLSAGWQLSWAPVNN